MTAKGVRHLLLGGTAFAVSIGAAQAQTTPTTGTAAGTVVSNTANATYTVNGSPGTAASNPSTFVVDRKVNLTVVVDQAANTQVNLGQVGAVTRFKVTNNTNGTQDFLLTAVQALSLGILPGTDNFDVTNVKVVVDDGDGIYDATKDVATYIDELAPDASRVVYIVGDVPTAAATQLAFVGLDAQVAAGGQANTQGAALVATDLNLLNQQNEIDVVFADNDNDGVLGADTVRNGQGWAYAAYEVGVRSVNLNIVKTSAVLSDGVNLANPKALPGATVQYCLTVTNSTLLTPASDVNLTDLIPANTTYVPNSIAIGGVSLAGGCLLNGIPQRDDGTNTTGPYRGSYDATAKRVTMTIPTLLGGASVAASFQVTIN